MGAAGRPRCAEHDGEAFDLAGSRGMNMSGQEIERENILGDVPSVASPSNPFEQAERECFPREHSWRPEAVGLYDLSLEKDSCGVGFIANIKGKKSHQI